jgi:hypothetical protein
MSQSMSKASQSKASQSKKPQRLTGWIGLAIAIAAPIALLATASAPASAQSPPPPPQFGLAAISYRIIVDSADSGVLARVKQVDRAAFFQSFADNRSRIQAGAFSSEAGARDRLNALARIGIPATAYNNQGQPVASTGANPPSNPGSGTPTVPFDAPRSAKKMPKGYYAIVPINRDQVGITFEALRKLNIAEEFINVGEELHGWHVAVGVYNTRQAAETMSQYLRRNGGFDARTYYVP